MKKQILCLALSLAPALLAAQTSATVQSSTTVSATAKTPRSETTVNGSAQSSADASASQAPSSYSAENRARIDAAFAAARKHNVPQQPIRDRIAEGQAKGASETQVALAAQHAETRLEATQQAMINAGRRQPSQAEVTSGYQAMVHGASEAQIQAVAQHTPSDRSLVVAFDALARLEARGMSSAQAESQLVAQLDAHASDATLGQLGASAAGSVNGATSVPRGTTTVTGSATGTATTAAGTATAVTGVAGKVGLGKPPM